MRRIFASTAALAPSIPAALLLGFALLAGSGCDDPAITKDKVAPSASASTSAAPAASSVAAPAPPPASASASAAAAPPKPKKNVADCPKEATVKFDDPTMETAVRRQLRKDTGPIQRSELSKVKTLDISQAPSDDELDPCIFPAFTGVKGLYLAPGKLDDLTPLKTLTQLESLRASVIMVKDLTPLSGLTKLDRLDLGRTPVSDLRPLQTLVNLTELQLDDTEVTDISPLAKLTKLEVLSLKRTRVADVSPLRGMTSLKQIYIEGSLVKDTSPLLSIPRLKIHED